MYRFSPHFYSFTLFSFVSLILTYKMTLVCPSCDRKSGFVDFKAHGHYWFGSWAKQSIPDSCTLTRLDIQNPY